MLGSGFQIGLKSDFSKRGTMPGGQIEQMFAPFQYVPLEVAQTRPIVAGSEPDVSLLLPGREVGASLGSPQWNVFSRSQSGRLRQRKTHFGSLSFELFGFGHTVNLTGRFEHGIVFFFEQEVSSNQAVPVCLSYRGHREQAG